MSNELLERLKYAVSFLPVDKFVTVDSDGACYVDWEHIDAADFADNSSAFAKAMRHIKCVQLTDGYLSPNAESEKRGTSGGMEIISTDLLAQVREHIKDMTNEQRIEFFYDIADGYCRHCGRDDSDSIRACQ